MAVPSSRQRWRPGRFLAAGFGHLPLFWKLLIPFLTLIVAIGVAGGFMIVRDLSSRAQATLDQELARRSLDARSVLRDRELYLLESANFASNLQGAAEAIRTAQAPAATRLLQSVLALKGDLDLLAGTGAEGRGLVEFVRPQNGAAMKRSAGGNWGATEFVASALRDQAGNKFAGFLSVSGRTMLAIVSPVCSGKSQCAPVGATVVGIGMDRLAGEALAAMARGAAGSGGIAVFDAQGETVARAGNPASDGPPSLGLDGLVRRTAQQGTTTLATVYTPLEVRGRALGTLAVSMPAGPAFDSVQGTGLRLGIVLVLAMAGIVALGAVLSRVILRQVRSLLDTNRALGRGDLSARAEVHWDDELGELASGVNETAEQLQASYSTLELRVAQRTEEVERLLKERTQFFASVSHDLRTPLAVILRNSEMLLDPAYRGNGRVRTEAAKALQASGSQLQTLISDILAIAQDEHGGIELGTEEVRVADAVREARSTLDALGRASGVRTKIRVPKDLPTVRADPRRLREIILNLVDNAVKYTPEGGTVEISAQADGDAVAIAVFDTGVGIPAGTGDRVFEPFYRVEGTTTQQGQASSGLGLAVVKRLVEAHGGRIGYQSVPGSGTTFTFTIPTADAVSSAKRGRGGRRHD